MSFEKPFESPAEGAVDETEFDDALAATQNEHPTLNRNSALPFLTELVKRNSLSRNNSEENYFKANLQQTLNQYNLSGPEAVPYRSLAGRYFGGHTSQRSTDETELTQIEKNESDEQLVVDSQKAELLHEHGEEEAERIEEENR